MKPVALVCLALLGAVGCRAPWPSCNFWAPYGSPCVQPPATGSINSSGNYYTPPARPSPTPEPTGFRPTTNNRWSNLDDPNAADLASHDSDASENTSAAPRVVDAEDLDVALTSHQIVTPSTTVIERRGPIRISQTETTGNGETLRLRGMPVSDATVAREPRVFAPSGRVVNIADLPDSRSSASTSPSNTISTASSNSDVSRQRSVARDGWKSKTASSGSAD